MTTICPLLQEHIFTINLDNDIHDDLIISTYNLLSLSTNTKKLTQFVHDTKNPMIFKILIELLPYSDWIKWFCEMNILKYYWSEEFIKKIIDSNTHKIYKNLCENKSIEKYVVCLNNSFDLNYNFVAKNLEKRIIVLQNILFKYTNLDLMKFCGGHNVIIYLGSNNIHIKNIYPKHIYLSFYPLSSKPISLYANIKTKTENNNTFINFTHENIIYTVNVCSWCVDDNTNKIFQFDTGVYNFHTKNIIMNAEGYQMFNKEYIFQKTKYETEKVYNTFSTNTSVKFYSPYICKFKFPKCYECYNIKDYIHLSEYESTCLSCGIKNKLMRQENADFTNYVFFITGVRVKIGYVTALKILKNNGKVIGTTRYVNATLYNFALEPDYETWKHNLIIVKCDFTNIQSVYKMLDLVKKYNVNVFINNAFMTIKHNEKYNRDINTLEHDLSEKISLEYSTQEIVKYEEHNLTDLTKIDTSELAKYKSQIKFTRFHDIYEEKHDSSWNKQIQDLDPREITECVAVNQLVPTLIINSILSTMKSPKFIIHVTSKEGSFSVQKTDHHIHTNMCKSAMNMLIRTLAENKELNVHAIDPGYVSGILPQLDTYPVNLEDVASKLLFPIIRYLNGNKLGKEYVNIRDYLPCEW